MKQRCSNPNQYAYQYYGAKGIKVCKEWADSFEAFLRDMGTRPGPEYSLDRIDCDGDYEPGNCRWATKSEQSRNRNYSLSNGLPVGVSLRDSGRYSACHWPNGKTKYIGTFDTPEEAHYAYLMAEKGIYPTKTITYSYDEKL